MTAQAIALFAAVAIDTFLFGFAISRIKRRKVIERRLANW